MRTPSVTIIFVVLAALSVAVLGVDAEEVKPRVAGVPAVEDVKAVKVVARPHGAEGPRCEFTTTEKFFLGNTVARLKKIDWTQEGTGLERIRIRQPEIELTVIIKAGDEHRYAFYWRGKSFIDHGSNRMLEVDLEFFRIDVIGELIRHCGQKKE